MNYILFDDYSRNHLKPLTLTRPAADLRIGIFTIREKWERMLKAKTSTLTETYLAVKWPLKKEKDTILINGSILPTAEMLKSIEKLYKNESLVVEGKTIAQRMDISNLEFSPDLQPLKIVEFKPKKEDVIKIEYPWDIFSHAGHAITADFKMATKGHKSQKPDDSNIIIGKGGLFIHKEASVFGATLNTTHGPIYIGKNAEVMEGSMIRGPFALGDNSTLKMGAKIYGPTTIGPHCKVGGELNNVVIFGYSNKAPDGFLGNSVIGEWCNLGADTNSSNLKNTYEEVKVWNYPNQKFIKTGLQFCGLIMGDHSKCGINTMFNTGTVVGVSANIFGPGFQRNFIPSFSLGGVSGFQTYNFDKALLVAHRVFKRRNIDFTDADKKIFGFIKANPDGNIS
jgi:UDP-N-acetylglucosamine diphosphorylase/glucosamine-1-phosphate N-acetyltransferase